MTDRLLQLMPQELMAAASLRGKEYAWSLDLIPLVIEAARRANLVSVGGQLQFRLPEGTTECYWIAVDTYASVSKALSWAEQVRLTAEAALRDFDALKAKWDFVAEGRKAFGEHFARFEAGGGHMEDAMCFVWYVVAEDED
jgi:hypothetical protein